MSKKPPKLTLVSKTVDPLSPPRSLGAAGRELWASIMGEYQVDDSAGLAMLAQACAAADRITEYAAAIARDGLTVRTKHGPKDHPLLRHELAARSFVVRTLQRLGLDVEPVRSIGRPAGRLG